MCKGIKARIKADKETKQVLNHPSYFVFAGHPEEVTRLITGFISA